MKPESDKIISTLNGLIQTCKDGQNGFRSASDSIQNEELKQLFTTYANQRATFAAELQAEVRRQGGDPEKGGSITGTLHRGWMQLKSTLLGQSESSILAECDRGEEAALKNYEAATHEVMPLEIQTLLAQQYKEIKDAHTRIHSRLEAVAGS